MTLDSFWERFDYGSRVRVVFLDGAEISGTVLGWDLAEDGDTDEDYITVSSTDGGYFDVPMSDVEEAFEI